VGRAQGRPVEVETRRQASGWLELFLPMGDVIERGDLFRIHPGCDERLDACIDRFNNLLNVRGEPRVPGQQSLMASPHAR
jgi:uncharacterized phage protein (TIGR02218 family)